MVIHRVSMEARYPLLIRYLRNKFPECIHVIYQAGLKGFSVYDRLAEDEVDCVVIPPHMATKPKVSRVETDKRDAACLALILDNHDFKDGCHIPDKERRGDRQITRTLIAIQKDIVHTRNRIHKFLDFHGIETVLPDSAAREQFRALKDLPLAESLKMSLGILLDQLEQLWAHQATLRDALRVLCNKERYKKAFEIARNLPGIGWVHRHQACPRTQRESFTFCKRQEDRMFCGTYSQ